MNAGKQFEADIKASCPKTAYIYRFRDSASSFGESTNTRFTPSNICDYLLFDDESRSLYFLELKTTKGASLPLSNIRENQIKQLTEAGERHNIIAGFVVNFREKENFTAFIDIESFNQMLKNLEKKSFNIEDMRKYGCVEINSQKKKVNYRYDLSTFIDATKKK